MRTAVNFAVLFVAAGLGACGGGAGSSSGTTVVNEQRTLSEGMQLSYALNAGTYEVNVTASNNGVVVSWPGRQNCEASSETKSYAATCALPSTGQLVVANPTKLGLGGSEFITVKLVKD